MSFFDGGQWSIATKEALCSEGRRGGGPELLLKLKQRNSLVDENTFLAVFVQVLTFNLDEDHGGLHSSMSLHLNQISARLQEKIASCNPNRLVSHHRGPLRLGGFGRSYRTGFSLRIPSHFLTHQSAEENEEDTD